MYVPEASSYYKVNNHVYNGSKFKLLSRGFCDEKEAWDYTRDTLETGSQRSYPNCSKVNIFFNPKQPVI